MGSKCINIDCVSIHIYIPKTDLRVSASITLPDEIVLKFTFRLNQQVYLELKEEMLVGYQMKVLKDDREV